jgi:hypothetical protein
MRTHLSACVLIAAFAGLAPAAAVDKPITMKVSASAPTMKVSASAPAKKGAPSGLSDATIEQNIRMKLAKSKIGADKFTIRVQNGVAYWEGNTNVIQHKGAATRMAKTAGAVAVVNHIHISEAAKQKAADRMRAKAGGTGVPKATVTRPKVDTAVPK